MSVTMKEIAMVVGVSQQAVSSALRGGSSSRVSEETRNKILAVARKLNYVENLSARQLRGKSIHAIGVVQAKSPHIAYLGMLNAVIDRLEELGYKSYVFIQQDGGESRRSVQSLISRGVDGVILLDCFCSEEVGSHGIPVLKVGSMTRTPALDIDKAFGARLAAEHLLEHGHRRFAFVCNNINASDNQKYSGVCAALEAAGLGEDAVVRLVCNDNPDIAGQLLEACREKQCRAFLCSNDSLAGALMKFFRMNDLRVPEDAAVVGFDGAGFGKFLEPALTSVEQPFQSLGRRAAERMVEAIKDPDSLLVPCEMLNPRLIPGGTCGCRIKPEEMTFQALGQEFR